jgi:predicted Zn-dependent protease
MEDLRNQAERTARSLCEIARNGESAEVRTSYGIRRKHRVSADQVRSTETLKHASPTMLRLARGGRDAYVSIDSVAGDVLPSVIRTARDALRFGRTFRDGHPLRPAPQWDEKQFVDYELAASTAPLAQLWLQAETLAERVGQRLGLHMSIADGLVTEQGLAEAFATSDRDALSFTRTCIETRLLVEVRLGNRRMKLWAERHTNRLSDLPLEDLLLEAGLRGASLLVEDNAEPEQPALLLTPRASASLLRLLVQDITESPSARQAVGSLRHRVVDDGQAVGGQHSRPFDHEGTPTGETVLLDPLGVVGELTCRGARWSGPAEKAGPVVLTGNGFVPRSMGPPVPLPTNARLSAPDRPDDWSPPERFSGRLGFNLRGEGTQRFRSGDRIRFRIDTATVRDGQVVGRGETLLVAASCVDMLRAVREVAPAHSYVPWADFSTASSWILFEDPGTFSTAM